MELRQVEHFVAVAIERSFTRAARRVHVVQSAVSTSVAKLERELGVQLFDRSRQQIELTVAGERFLAQAHELLRVAGSAAESVASSRGRLMGSVEFGSLISYGPMNVAQVLGEFHRAHPLVRLRLQLNQSGASAYLSALVDGALDLALVSVPNRLPPQLEMRLMFEEPMLFVCRDDHPMAAEKVVGLLDEEGFSSTSTTETFAAITVEVDTRRWAGVPFYLRTGKRLGRRVTEIALLFKRAPHLPFDATMTDELGQNALVIRVQPDEGITLRFGSKVPGHLMEVRDVSMDFSYGSAFAEDSPEAYERLILDVLLGEPSLFPVNAEVELSWKILDPALEHWAEQDKSGGRPEPYESGTWGPESAFEMLRRSGRDWRRP